MIKKLLERCIIVILMVALSCPICFWSASAEEINLSIGKPITAYTFGHADGVWMPVTNVNDGNNGTLWESTYYTAQPTDLQWVQIDLGGFCNISKVSLYARNNAETERSNFKILASNDENFGEYVVLGEQGSEAFPGDTTKEFPVSLENNYRYVRLQQTVGGYWVVSELSVFGEFISKAPEKLSVNRPITVSSDSGMYGSTPGKINDGYNSSFWESDFNQTALKQWFVIDLERPCKISYTTLYARNAGDTERQNFEIQASNDPSFSSYSVIGSQGSTPFPADSVNKYDFNGEEYYQYVRLIQTQTGYFLVSEFSVYGEEYPVYAKEYSYTRNGINIDELPEVGVLGFNISLKDTDMSASPKLLLVLKKGDCVLEAKIADAQIEPAVTRMSLDNDISTYLTDGVTADDLTLQAYLFEDFDNLMLAREPFEALGAQINTDESIFSDSTQSLWVDYENLNLSGSNTFEDFAGKNALTVIMKPNADGTAVELSESNVDKLYALTYNKLDEIGKNNFSIPLDDAGGLYRSYANAYYGNLSSTLQSNEAFFATDAVRETVMSSFFGVTLKSDFEGYLQAYGKSGTQPTLQFEASGLYPQEFYDNFLSLKPNTQWTQISALEDTLYSAEALAKLRHEAVTGEFLNQYVAHIGVVVNKYYTDAIKPSIAELIEKDREEANGVMTITMLRSSFDNALLLSAINAANREKLTEIVNDYFDVLGLEYGDIDPILVNKALVDVTYNDVSSFKSDFSNRIDEIEAENKKPVYSPGGGDGIRFESSQYKTEAKKEEDKAEKIKNELPFNDVSEVLWAIKGIEFLYKRGIVGRSEGNFEPFGILKREEGIRMILAALEADVNADNVEVFSDVKASDWFAPYVSKAYALGITTGFPDGRFGVGHTLSRQDFCVLIYRLLDKEAVVENTGFIDEKAIEDYAKDAVAALVSKGIIAGFPDGSFQPNEPVNRAQAAKILYEAFGTGEVKK